MDNDELLGALEWEGSWAELIATGADAELLLDPIVKEKFKEAIEKFSEFCAVTEELSHLLGSEGY